MSLKINSKCEFWDQGMYEYVKGTIASIQLMEGYFCFATIKYYSNKKHRSVDIYREDWIKQ